MSGEQPKRFDCDLSSIPAAEGCVCIFLGEIIEIIEMGERRTTKTV